MTARPTPSTHRTTVEEFYRLKWEGHASYWEARYPRHQRVYAASVYRRRNDEILASIRGPVGRALDLGCGAGDVSLLLAGRCRTVVGADVADANVELTRRNLLESGATGTHVLHSEAERLPFADGSFDLVVLADVIEHVPDAGRALSEVRRVLGDGGRLVCVTPLRGTLGILRTMDRVAGAVGERRDRQPGVAGPEVFERFFTKRDMERGFREAGFRIERFRRTCFYPAPETGGTFGAVMGRVHRRVGDERFEAIARRLIRAFGAVERLRVMNQKQLWVVRR